MRPTNLDMDVLRSFVTGIDLGGYGRAAARLGRSPSAISLQLRKLEDQVGRPLFLKQGRSLALTEAGEALLGYARRLLDLNDTALSTLRDGPLAGEVRIGLPQDIAETKFPEVLARFSRLYPKVRVQAQVDRNAALRAGFAAGDLDLALHWSVEADAGEPIRTEAPMAWIGPRGGFRPEPDQPLPLVLFEAPCMFRHAALAALDRIGMAWQIKFSSPSLSGVWAAVGAGLGITVRTVYGLPPMLAPIAETALGLPPLPRTSLALLRAPSQDDGAVGRMAAMLRETFSPMAA